MDLGNWENVSHLKVILSVDVSCPVRTLAQCCLVYQQIPHFKALS